MLKRVFHGPQKESGSSVMAPSVVPPPPLPSAHLQADRTVVCPSCGTTIQTKRAPRGTGAQYVQKWTHCGAKILAILGVWQADRRFQWPVTKNEAITIMQGHPGMTASTGSMYARLSEMIGLGLLRISDSEYKLPGSHDTAKAPRYLLTDKARRVFQAGGRLA